MPALVGLEYTVVMVRPGRKTDLRLLIKVVAIAIAMWTIVWVFIWAVSASMDDALLSRSPSLGSTLTFFAAPAVGWTLVIVMWALTEKPWRSGYFTDDHDDGVWIGNTYVPNRRDTE